jgi:hypothetical protein
MKNSCAKTRPASDPYEIWKNHQGWEWRILKRYQSPDKEAANPYARVFCAVSSPFTFGGQELGDVYVSEIKKNAFKVS